MTTGRINQVTIVRRPEPADRPVLRGGRDDISANTTATRAVPPAGSPSRARFAAGDIRLSLFRSPERRRPLRDSPERKSTAPGRPSRGPGPAGSAIQRPQRAVSPKTRKQAWQSASNPQSPSTTLRCQSAEGNLAGTPWGPRQGKVGRTAGHPLQPRREPSSPLPVSASNNMGNESSSPSTLEPLHYR